ncbi:CHAP domain-containing protein [Roseomonas sp. BN140053]|uniref:CHAP domain-containing protein n=1 Tax=Roseomonas sp. BN140053 TaxID=3391898 RepID=UPI0039EC8560
MPVSRSAIAVAVLCSAFLLPCAPQAEAAQARQGAKQTRQVAANQPSRSRPAQARSAATVRQTGSKAVASRRGRGAVAVVARSPRASEGATDAMYYAGISCVPYARQVTGMQVSGNGGQWWYNAAGQYARGQRPEPGSVLAFRSSGGMRMGHVAVVERLINPREIEIQHANWGGPGIRKGTVMHGVSVVDVSDRNDWTAVRVQVGRFSEAYGRTYSTFGFIHNRPERGGVSYASSNSAPRYEEVAEAPVAPVRASGRTLDLSVAGR